MTTDEKKFGRYEIRSEIGRGGMATVFQAYDSRFEREVAIKVLPHEFLHDPQFRVRFEREAKTIAMLEHPAIVPVYDFGEEEGQPYIVMRYMSGGSLADRLHQGPLPLKEVAQIVSRLAPALDAAHSKGIIHRDLKPGNILFDQYGNAYISDFGIARLKQSSGATLTGTAILGTPAYMSPEQIQGDKEIDGRSDLYSFGIILFQMLTGATPYQSDTPAKVMMMHLLEPVPQVKKVKADIPRAFDAVTERALAKTPEERFQTADEMASAVEAAVREETTEMRQASAATRIAAPVEKSKTKPLPAKTVVSPGAEAQAQPRRGIPVMGVILGGFAGIGLLATVVLIALFALRPPWLFPQAVATNTVQPTAVVLEPTNTEQPTATLSPTGTPTLEPSVTSLPTERPTDTAEPTITPAPTETPTLVPVIPTIGGADKLALLDKNNNIWVMNVDGSNPIQLTAEGAAKDNLQWSPDGQSVVFVSGNCAKMVNAKTGRMDDITCIVSGTPNVLKAFQISPDGQQVAVSFLNELYVIPYNLDLLKTITRRSQLQTNAVCAKIAPYASNTGTAISVKWVQWSRDMKQLAVDELGVDQGKQVDLIDVLNISSCSFGPYRQDEFPTTRFTIDGYSTTPWIENFTWDGEYLFALTGGRTRNGGFGHLYLYNTELHKGQQIDPINGACCYRDPSWSPDGSALVFAFQDNGLNITQIYIVPYGSIGSGASYTPIPLPANFFSSNKKDKPLPVLGPAK